MTLPTTSVTVLQEGSWTGPCAGRSQRSCLHWMISFSFMLLPHGAPEDIQRPVRVTEQLEDRSPVTLRKPLV